MKKAFSILLIISLFLSLFSPSLAWNSTDKYSELREDEFLDQGEYTEQFAKIVCVKEVGDIIDKSTNITNEFGWYLDKHPDYEKITSKNQIVSWMQQDSIPSNYPTTIWKYPSSKINAFATPGGFIFITSGLLNQYRSGAISNGEMAFLLSHEFTHARAGHGFSHRNTGILATIFMTAAYLFARNSDNKYVRQGAPAAAAIISILVLSNISQEDENFADTIATKETIAMGYPDNSGITLLQKINGDTKITGANEFDSRCYFKSHPDLDERIENIQEAASEYDESLAQFFNNYETYTSPTNTVQTQYTASQPPPKINVYVINSNYNPPNNTPSPTNTTQPSPEPSNTTNYNVISLTPPSSATTGTQPANNYIKPITVETGKTWSIDQLSNNQTVELIDTFKTDYNCSISIYNSLGGCIFETNGPTSINLNAVNNLKSGKKYGLIIKTNNSTKEVEFYTK